ncbi:MAG TPA: DedA family protein [Candidatus Eremiobacteraceae bacterium]|nr:DedA family protein [Candidatus Eremiobacteraceae bacterium]
MHLFHAATQWVMDLIRHFGYGGILLGMMLQAIGVPLPSEVMMSFGGYLAYTHELVLFPVIVCGTAGDTIGAVIAYVIGFYGGRPLVERFGKLVFVRERELAHAHDWIVRFGARAVFACKLLPGVRAVASLPAGVVRMPFGRFITFTFLASAIWCTGFSYAGVALGRNWDVIDKFFGRFAILLMVFVVIGIGIWIWSHLRMRAQRAAAAKS